MNRIKELRKERGLTQATLAASVGWDTSTIQRLESGARKLKLDQITALARALRVAPADIISPEGHTSTTSELLDLLQGMSEDEQATLLKVAKGLAASKQDKKPAAKPPRVA